MRKRRLKIIMWVFYVIFFLGNACVLITFRVLAYWFKESFNEWRHFLNILFCFRFIVRIVLDTYIIYNFITSYFFLVKMKKETQVILTTFNKRVIAATMAMLAIFIVMVYMRSISSSLLNISFFNFSEDDKNILRIFTQVVVWALEFILFTALVYLFHYQGRS